MYGITAAPDGRSAGISRLPLALYEIGRDLSNRA